MERTNLKRLLHVIIFLVLTVTFPTTPLQAQSNTIQMEVVASNNGYFKYGEWLPVFVLLENQGSDLEGEIRVQVNSSQGSIIYASPVSLPSGARKKIPVYVLPNNFSRELKVQLISKGKTILSEGAAVQPQANISYFAGIISPERGALAFLNGTKFPGQERPMTIIDLSLDLIPERDDGLRSFDLIVINDTDTSKLLPDQANALENWVQHGGHLVIGGGAGVLKTLSGLPDSILPAVVNGTEEITTSDLTNLSTFANNIAIQSPGPYVISRVDLKSNSKIIVGDTNLPIIIRQDSGDGIVDFVSLDLSGMPFNGWPGGQTFWENLIGPRGSYPQNMPFDVSPRQYRANSLYYTLSNIPSLDLPSIKWIIILISIYIIIVGPINYLILRRQHKLHFAWVTIPALTALFAAGSFGVGYTMRGNDLVLNKISLVNLNPNGNASYTSYMGLFSPRQQDYEVTVEGNSLLSPMTGYEDPWATSINSTGGEMVFTQGSPATVRGLTINQWSMQSFMSEGIWDNFGQITGELKIENDILLGTVVNETQFTLMDVVVVMQNRFVRLGDMEPGSTKDVNLGLSNLQGDRFGPGLSYRLFQENYASGGQLPRLVELKTNIVSSVFENTPWAKSISSSITPMGYASNSGVSVIAWLNEAPPEITVDGNNLSYQTTTMVYSNLSYSLPDDGFLTLPPGLVPGAVTTLPPNSGTCGFSTSVSMARGQAEFEFQIPENLPELKINSLKLVFWSDNSGLSSIPNLSLYHWEKQSWDAIQDPIQGTNVIENAKGYVNDSGVIRVQIDSENDMFSCIYLDIGLDAEISMSEGG